MDKWLHQNGVALSDERDLVKTFNFRSIVSNLSSIIE